MEDSPCGSQLFCTDLTNEIVSFLKNKELNDIRVKLHKRNRDLYDGEFALPFQSILERQVFEKLLDGMKVEMLQNSQTWKLPLKDMKITSFDSLAFYIDRPLAFKNILTSVHNLDFSSFQCQPTRILISNGDMACCTPDKKHNQLPLEYLRSIIVMQHLKGLLTANGFKVEFVKYPMCQKLEEILQGMNFDAERLKLTPTANTEAAENSEKEVLLQRAKDSGFIVEIESESEYLSSTEVEGHTTPNPPITPPVDNESSSLEVTLNLHGYVTDRRLAVGKGKLDKNLHHLLLKDDHGHTDTLNQMYYTDLALQSLHPGKEDVLLHVSSDKRCFTQQKINIALRILNPDVPIQTHIVHGPVQSRKSEKDTKQQLTCEQFYRLRYDQMKQASVIKYGEEVCGSGWDDTLHQLTSASIKFEFLNSTCKTAVKLDFSECNDFGGGVDNRTGAFVMYNCARLCTLLRHFDAAVAEGKYPPLPDISEVDFSTLREEDEWVLLFNYILVYTDLLKECVSKLVPENGDIFSQIHTHKISNYLVSLSHCVSCYYSRRHILGENRPQLLPTMYARLYLLKTVYKILKHALSLLDIPVLSQL